MTDDEQSSVADDAVSNRSDDTAIDDGEGVLRNGQRTVRRGAAGSDVGRPSDAEPVDEPMSEVDELRRTSRRSRSRGRSQ